MASELETLTAIESSNDLNPIQQDRLKELRSSGATGNPYGIESQTGSYLTPGGPGSPTGAPGGQDFAGLLSQAQGLYQQAGKPQIEALQGQKSDIETRYKDLVADITKTGRQAKTEEYARRGIPISSGMLESQLGQQLAGPIAQAGQAQSGEMSNIANIIAQLQSGGQTNAIQTALSLLGIQTSSQQNAAQMALQQQQLGQSQQQIDQGQQQWQQQWPYMQREYEYNLAAPYYKPTNGNGETWG